MIKDYLKRIHFKDVEDMCDYLALSSDQGEFIAVVCNFDLAEDILRNMLRNNDFRVGILDLENEDYDYCGEYAVSVYEGRINVEHAWHEANEYHGEGFYDFPDEVVLIAGDIPSSFLNHCTKELAYEIVFGEDKELDGTHRIESDSKESEKNKSVEKTRDDVDELVESFAKLLGDFFRPLF